MMFRSLLLCGGSIAALGSVSDARLLATGETQALAFDFTDDYFNATTSHYGSAYVQDTGTPANNYDSHPYGLLTYTSPSAKMTLGPSGTLRFGAHNMVVQSNTFSTSWTKTLNSAFTSGQSGPSGSSAWRFTGGAGMAGYEFYQAVTLVSGATYTWSIKAKAGTASWIGVYAFDSSGYLTYFDLANGAVGTNAAGNTASIEALEGGWYLCSVTRTVSGTSGYFDAILCSGNGAPTTSGSVYADVCDAHLRRTPSDSTYLSTTSAARYALPYEWDSSGNLLGILVEEARTNLATYSEQFDNAVWTEIGVSAVSAGTQAAPDGTLTAETFTASAGSGAHAVYSSATTVVSGSTYAGSVFVKKGTHRYIALTQQRSSGNTCAAVFDLDGGGSTATETYVGGTSGAVALTKQEALGSGWYRLTLAGSASGTTCYLFVGFANAASGNAFDLTGQVYFSAATTETAHFWGAQLEAGSFPTSYIPTLGSTVTRAADNISLATSAFPYSATSTLFALWTSRSAASTDSVIAQIDSGTPSSDKFAIQEASASNNILFGANSGSVLQASIGGGTQANGTSYKCAAAATTNDAAMVLDGTVIGTDASYTAPASITTLRIGTYGSGNFEASAHIKQLMYLPRRMSNADMQVLTT